MISFILKTVCYLIIMFAISMSVMFICGGVIEFKTQSHSFKAHCSGVLYE